ncbi:MAG: FAD-dependent oxidoreductase [Pseudomonadota bacterium]
MISRRTFLSSTAALAAPALLKASRSLGFSGNYAITRWRSDPLSGGSYSFLSRGAESAQRGDLAAPLGPLFFAGEATTSDHPSTVHGALLSGRRAADEIATSGKRRVAIIGAGFAGLGAAAHLTDAGIDVEIYEARDRLGGRVHTADLAGAKIDLGASWIHGTDLNPLTELADTVGTERRVTDWDAFQFFNNTGRPRRNPFPPRGAADLEISQSYGADPDLLSPAAYTEGYDFDGDEVTFTRGYASLIPALLRDYKINLGKPVSRIIWNETGGATLVFRGGNQAYDAALITVPLGALKSGAIEFSPALPDAKRAAINDLGMGHLSKVFLRFDEPFWNPDLHAFGYVNDDPASFASWVNIQHTNDAPILMTFHGGRAADTLETQSHTAIIAEALRVLRKIWA